MTKEQAEKAGYAAMTRGYILPDEQWMLDNVLTDMRRGNIKCILIDFEGTEVWRKPNAS